MTDTDSSTVMFMDSKFRNSKGKVVDPPVLEGRIADTHCHLDMLDNPGLVLARCAYNNVMFLGTVVETSENPMNTYDLLADWLGEAVMHLDSWGSSGLLPTCKVIAGCHPQLSANYTKETDSITRRCAAHPLTVAIGEIGLDYHYDNAPHEVQIDVFKRQLQLAKEVDKPVAMHIRDAHDDALKVLQAEGIPKKGALVHCFTNDFETLQPFLEMGCYVAFGGALTFNNGQDIREAAARVPLNRIVTETDSPYMAPVPLRGTICTPDQVIFTANTLAQVRGVQQQDRAQFYETIYQNALNIYHVEPDF